MLPLLSIAMPPIQRFLLSGAYTPWSTMRLSRAVGVVAGRTPRGIGRLFADLGGEHDGTVAVAETRLPGIAAHCVVDASHTGLVVSAAARRQVLRFLRDGRFERVELACLPLSGLRTK